MGISHELTSEPCEKTVIRVKLDRCDLHEGQDDENDNANVADRAVAYIVKETKRANKASIMLNVLEFLVNRVEHAASAINEVTDENIIDPFQSRR